MALRTLLEQREEIRKETEQSLAEERREATAEGWEAMDMSRKRRLHWTTLKLLT
jgi:hypothetical protein